MSYRNSVKRKLSKGILEMKFMKKSKDEALKEIQEAEGRSLFESQITEGMKAGMSNYILESSFIPCENLIEGRLSFRGMNPEIERLMELEELAKRPPVNRAMNTDISDVEMAQFRLKHSLVETVASKYKTKKSRKSDERKNLVKSVDESPVKQDHTRKKPKFLKPEDE